MKIENIHIGKRYFDLLIFTLGLLCVQRNLLNPFHHLIFVIPAFISLYLFLRRSKLFLTVYILTIFFSIDNGGELYKVSPSLLRVPLYLLGIMALIIQKKFCANRSLFIFWSITICSGALFSIMRIELLDRITFVRDLIVFGIIFILILQQKENNINFIGLTTLYKGILGYLLGDFLNVIFFGWGEDFNYINYHSLKSLILFPTFYIFYRKRYEQLIWLIPLTFTVVAYYGTRMIFVVYLLILTIFLFSWIRNNFKVKNIILVTSIVLLLLTNINWRQLEKFKVTYTIIQIMDNLDSSKTILKLIDPVRNVEHNLFFERPIYEILIGSGLGSGLSDVEDNFKFIRTSNNTGAFSRKEINTGRFYNLHDTWIDLGLRIGLIWIVLIFFYSIQKINVSKNEERLINSCVLVLLLCSTFSYFGIISTALLFNLNQNPQYNNA